MNKWYLKLKHQIISLEVKYILWKSDRIIKKSLKNKIIYKKLDKTLDNL